MTPTSELEWIREAKTSHPAAALALKRWISSEGGSIRSAQLRAEGDPSNSARKARADFRARGTLRDVAAPAACGLWPTASFSHLLLNRAFQSFFSSLRVRTRMSAWWLRNVLTARSQLQADCSCVEEGMGGKDDVLFDGAGDWGRDAEMASTDEAETKVCFGQTEIGRSSRRKTNLHSTSWQTEHWNVSCVKPTTIPNSSGFTAVKIISPPHAMQRMSQLSRRHPKVTRAYGRIRSVDNCR